MEQKKSLRMGYKKRVLVLGSILMLALLPIAGKAIGAEEYPTKTITIICGYSPGGSTDRQVRLVLPFVQKHLGKSVIVENLTGASGILATNKVFTSPPDGYTLLVASIPTTILQEKYLPETSRYQTRALTHVFSFVKEEFTILSHPDVWKNFTEFYEASKGKRLRVGIPGKGTDAHLRTVMLEEMAEVRFNIIPFEGGGPAMTAVAGKHVDAVMTMVSSSSHLVRSGTLNPLLVFSDRRHPAFPQTPVPKEVGFKTFEPMVYVTGIFAPPKLSDAKVKVLEEAFSKAVKEQEFLETAKKMAVDVHPLDSRDFLAYTEKEYPRIEKYVEIFKGRRD